MSKLRIHTFSLSLDGYGAGPRQDRNEPLGVGGEDLHEETLIGLIEDPRARTRLLLTPGPFGPSPVEACVSHGRYPGLPRA